MYHLVTIAVGCII